MPTSKLWHQVLYNRPPKEMVDKNIRTDYKKQKMLADIDRVSRLREHDENGDALRNRYKEQWIESLERKPRIKLHIPVFHGEIAESG